MAVAAAMIDVETKSLDTAEYFMEQLVSKPEDGNAVLRSSDHRVQRLVQSIAVK